MELFNYLTGRSLQREYRKLLVAPLGMRDRFLAMIEREAEHAKAGRPAQIIVKCNALEERTICRALYRASQAGVKIDLIIRGFCCLRPGVAGVSENIRVISVIGRFLEHSRVIYFRNGNADPLLGDFYIGSADWMYRNLLARVEISAPIEDRPLREMVWTILQVMLHDRRQAWDMQPDGSYVQRRPPASADPAGGITAKAELLGTHQVLMDLARSRVAAAPAHENGAINGASFHHRRARRKDFKASVHEERRVKQTVVAYYSRTGGTPKSPSSSPRSSMPTWRKSARRKTAPACSDC